MIRDCIPSLLENQHLTMDQAREAMNEMMSGQAKLEDGTVDVRVYYRPEQEAFAIRHREAAIGAIERFSAWFVPYPWPIMSIIDPPPCQGGIASSSSGRPHSTPMPVGP